jgi:lipopolysaccharide export system permease protein
LTLYHGESSGNLKGNNNRAGAANDAVPFRRETFDEMEMWIEFDSNMKMMDESMYKDRHIAKNLAGLKKSIDSMTVKLDSIKELTSKSLFESSYRKALARPNHLPVMQTAADAEAAAAVTEVKHTIRFDSLYTAQDKQSKAALLEHAKRNAESIALNYSYNSTRIDDKELRLHHTEMHKKFTLSVACLIFFFIGAPLGAIIRKGGLGAPAVLSVFLFIVYYVVDNSGYKLARDGIWLPWQGMWLSSAVLFPLGVFLTYKAVNDSVLLNAETYIETFKRLIGKREYRKIEKKELILEHPDYGEIKNRLQQLKSACRSYVQNNKRWLPYFGFWQSGGTDREAGQIANQVEEVVEQLRNSDHIIVLNKIMDFPIISTYQLSGFHINAKWGLALAICFPLGGIIYLIAIYRRKLLYQDLNTTVKVCDELMTMI